MADGTLSPIVFHQWRRRIVDVVTLVLFIVALPLLVLNSFIALGDGSRASLVIGPILIALLGVIAFVRSIPPTVRGIALIAIPYISGTFFLISSG